MRGTHVLGGMAALAATVLAWTGQPDTATAAGRTVVCQSENYHYSHCPLETAGGVALVDQLSSGRGRCIAGENWGWDRRGVWVKDGCRAVFSNMASGRGWGRDRQGGRNVERQAAPGFQAGRGFSPGAMPGGAKVGGAMMGGTMVGGLPARFGDAGRAGITIDCASQSYRRAECPVDTRGGVMLVQQLSSNAGACVEGRSWGWTRQGIWVVDGCRGRFRVGPDSRRRY